MSGVTDALIGGAAAAVRGERAHMRELAASLRAKHHAAAADLVSSADERPVVADPIDQRLAEFAMLCDALAVLGEASPRALDAVSSLGERMSVHLLAGALRAGGTPALPVDAAEIVRTDDAFQAAEPDMAETRRLSQEMLGADARRRHRPGRHRLHRRHRGRRRHDARARGQRLQRRDPRLRRWMPTKSGSTRTWTAS